MNKSEKEGPQPRRRLFILTIPYLVNIINLIKQEDEESKTLAKVTENWKS
jgi:hypothetical protein